MAKDPRPPPPGSSEPDEALELLRALARSRGSAQPPEPEAPLRAAGDEKLDALRELAAKLDLQLRGASPGAHAPGPPPSRPPPSGPPALQPPPSFSPAPVAPPRLPPPQDVDETPARPTWHQRLRLTLRHEWRALVGALPDAGMLVPRFDRTQIAFIGISVGVLLIAAIGGIVGMREPQVASDQMVPPIAPSTPNGPSASTGPAPPDLATITAQMNECDAVATKDPNSLYFFVLPLVVAKGAAGDWPALSEVGNAFLLLSGQTSLDGLRNGKLTVRPGRYTFAVLDSASGRSFTWTSATSVARLSRPVPPDVKMIKLGFDFSAAQTGTATWSAEFRRDPGTCYWVSVLVRE